MKKKNSKTGLNLYTLAGSDRNELPPLRKWESQENSGNGIFSKDRSGLASFAVDSTHDYLGIRLSLFCEYEARGTVYRRGNFYIKFMSSTSKCDLEEFIFEMSNFFSLNAKNISVYKIKEITIFDDEFYYILEIPEEDVRRNTVKSDGYILSKIYWKMTLEIQKFANKQFNNEYRNVHIVPWLYAKGLYAHVKYDHPSVEVICIEKDSKTSKAIRPFNLFYYATYRVIYKIIIESENNALSNFRNKCNLFYKVLRLHKFTDINFKDSYLRHFVVALLNLKEVFSRDIRDIQDAARELATPYIRAMKSKGMITTCAGLKCSTYKAKSKCGSIQNPFYLLNELKFISEEIFKYKYECDTVPFDVNDAATIIKKFFDYSEGRQQNFLLLLFLFGAVAISNCRFSIHYNNRVYNNSAPFIFNTSTSESNECCVKLIYILEIINTNIIQSVKATEIAKILKCNSSLIIADMMENGRFSILQMACTYSQLSEKCLKNITKFGLFDSDKSPRVNAMVVSGDRQFEDCIKKGQGFYKTS